MALRPPEFVVDPDEPFKNDTLGRERPITTLTEIIVDEDQAAVISVNGGFGSGKSAFLKMLAANLRRQEGTEVLEFNAWQQSYTSDPLVDLVSALAMDRDDRRDLLEAVGKFGLRVAKGVGISALSFVTGGMVHLGPVEDAQDGNDEALLPAWAQTESAVAEFTDGLRTVVGPESDDESGSVKLVIIVDELDRCRPDYAIDMLNVVRHLFAVPGVTVVLGVNQEELEHRVVEVFGPKTKADVYLRRFVDLPVSLRAPDPTRIGRFVNSALQQALAGGQLGTDWVNAALELLLSSSDTSLRDVQQLASLAVRVVPRGSDSSSAAYHRLAALSLIVLRHVDRQSYEGFVGGASDAFTAVADLRAGFPAIAVSEESESRDTLDYLESMLFHVIDEQRRTAATSDDFFDRFDEAQLGDVDDAARILEIGTELRRHRPAALLSIREIANRIDLLT